MRYYDVQVSDSGGKLTKHWTSHPRGISSPPDAGALKVEIDAFSGPQGTPLPGSLVRLWGISLDDIGRASDLNGHDLVLRGGMGKGLPLANPAQSGILIQGHIQQAFSNWIGTSMTLDLILVAGSVSAGTGAAQNFVVNWPKGQALDQALKNTIQTVAPKAKLNFNISSNLKNAYDELHFAGTWAQLAEYVVEQSRRILSTGPALAGQWNTPVNALSKYPGAQIHLDGDTINVFDGTTEAKAKQITIYDLVGQPTWIGPQVIQVTMVMRGDLKIGGFISLPPTRAIVTAASMSPYSKERQDVLFQGTFMINKIHHVGNYKDPGALSWVTVVDAAIQVKSTDKGASLDTGLSTGTPPAAGGVVGGFNQVRSGPSPTEIPTGDSQGLVSSAPPSAFTSAQSQTQSAAQAGAGPGTVDTLAAHSDLDATAGTQGLTQTTPAPSLGQSVDPDIQTFFGSF